MISELTLLVVFVHLVKFIYTAKGNTYINIHMRDVQSRAVYLLNLIVLRVKIVISCYW